MPVRLANNVAVKNFMKTEGNRIQSRKKSRLSLYLNTTARQDIESDDNITIFNETYVQNVLETQQERKKKRPEKGEKLKLVWKGTYNPSKSPQESLTDLLIQRNTPKKLRFTPGTNRKPVWARSHIVNAKEGTSSNSQHNPKLGSSVLGSASMCGNSSNQCEEIDNSDLVSQRSIQRFSCKKAFIPATTACYDEFGFIEYLQTPTPEDSSITLPKQCCLDARFSRTIFQTKRATDHQEQNMFSYRVEKKRAPKIDEEKRSSTQSSCDRNLMVKIAQIEREKLVPELKYQVDVDTILRAYLSEQFLELKLEGKEADSLRLLYESTILKQPVIHNLIMQHPNMLPSRIFSDLVTFKKGFEVNPIYSPTVVKADEGPWRESFIKSLSSPSGTVLVELENDVPQYANFYKSLLEARIRAIKIDKSWLKEKKSHAIREKLVHLAVGVRIGRQNPGSTIRFDLMSIFEAAARNNRLLRQLALSVDGWLNQLVQGLQSPFKSVRDETCQVLCFMTSSYPIMKELYLSKYFDVVQDICVTVLRAIDQHEDTFPEYYILLAHLIHYCPSRSIIDSLIERWNNFRCIGLILQWPRLMYYALRYWPDDALCLGSRLFSIRVTKALESALQRPLTTKVSRNALYYSQVRFHNASNFFTIYYNKESAQSSLMGARAGRFH